MKARYSLTKLAVTSLAIATFYNIKQPTEIFAFGIGGGSSSNNSCKVFEYLNHKDNQWVKYETSSGTISMPLLVYFNSNCAKTKALPHAVEHINGTNGKTNVFVLRRTGDIVAYTPDLGEYDYLISKKGSMSHISATTNGNRYGNIGDNRHGTSFLNYSVPANDTSCGYSPKKGEGGYQPVCIEDKTYFKWGHFLKSNTEANRKKLADAIAKNDEDKIASLTGEWEYVGYSYDGTMIPNPYFPSDWPIQYNGSGNISAYPSVTNPWNWGTAKSKYDIALKGEDDYWIKYNAIVDFKTQETLKGSISTLMNKFSLKNDYRYSAGVFETRGDKIDDKSRYYALALVNAPVNALNNVALMELAIYDGNTKVASWTRKATMMEYGEAYILKDKNGKLVKLEGGKTYKASVTVLNDSRQALTMPHKIDLNIEAEEIVMTGEAYEELMTMNAASSGFGMQKTQNLSKNFTMPDTNGFVELKASLNDENYGAFNHWKIDDMAKVIVQVEAPKGDISVCDIKLFEKGGKTEITEDDLVQDREYDVEYHICYTGANVEEKQDVKIEGTLSTSGQHHEEISLDRTISIPLDKTNVIRETIRVSKPEINTNIKISIANKNLNTNLRNDSMSKTYSNAPNIKLTNLKITPDKINFKPLTGCHTVTVSYNLTLTDVKSDYNSTFNTQTRLMIGGKEYTVTDRIKKGTSKYTHNLDYCFEAGETSQTKKVIAEANKNQAMYESTISDNTNEIDWIGVTDTSSLTGCPVDGTVKNEVEWTQTYVIDTIDVWYENGRLMQKVTKSETKTVTNQTESFKITSIQMRSKLQQDLQLGNDGWVEVLGLENNHLIQVNTPKIKAGYGFEFKIEAEYTTNAFDNVNQTIDTNALEEGKKQTIQVVSAGSHKSPNLVNDFYLNIGGKTINVGTGLDLEVEKSGTNNSTNVFKVTITPHHSPNTGEANDTRLYVSENTADGIYQAKFFTPAIIGLTSRSENEDTILCDEIEIDFEVIGSVYDDLNTHVG